jgi:dolichol-phosphate mannosyltransferase
MQRSTIVKFAKFGLVGGTGLLVNLAVTYILTQFLGLWYLLAYVIATFISWNVVFFANSLFTFVGHSKENYARRYMTFMIGYCGLFLVNTGIVYICTSILHFYYLLSIIFATAVITIFTFFFAKQYIYTDS